MSDCDQFKRAGSDPGRYYELCTGCSHSNRAAPTLEQANSFRNRFKLPPISEIVSVDVSAADSHGEFWSMIDESHREQLKTMTQRPRDAVAENPLGSKPGDQFYKLCDTLQIKMPTSCSCRAVRKKMNKLGVNGCRAKKDQIVGQLRQNASKVGFVDKIKAAAASVATGLVFKLDPLDPIPSLFDEAVRRAEAEQPESPPEVTQQTIARPLIWAYGVSTTPARINDLLPQTLASLARGGFDQPRLFVDGCDNIEIYKRFGLPVTLRPLPNVGNFGNWWMSLIELFTRNPGADRYVLFEDDILCCRNLRQFLEQCELPAGYWNLFTFPQNEKIAKARKKSGWFEAVKARCDLPWPVSRGLGAQGLMFDRDTLVKLLKSPSLAAHPLCSKGRSCIDGAIAYALGHLHVYEQCHYPSLLQHVGRYTTIPGNPQYPPAKSFPGEDFDCLELLKQPGGSNAA